MTNPTKGKKVMTNPFARTAPKPDPVSDEVVAEAASRDYSDNAFPSFEMDIPDRVRGAGRSSDPTIQAFVDELATFEPHKQAKIVGFINTSDDAVNKATKTLLGKIKIQANKQNIPLIGRTIVHPSDRGKPSHQQRHVFAYWRDHDAE